MRAIPVSNLWEFAFQVSAQMPTGQGRVGLILLFSFHLEVLDRILVLRGLGPAGLKTWRLGGLEAVGWWIVDC